MSKRMILIFLLAILVMIPVTSAEEYSIEMYDYRFVCPMNNRIIVSLGIFETVDFGFDNFTVIKYDLNITSSSLLDIRVCAINETGNSSIYQIFRTQAFSCNLTIASLFYQLTYNSSYWIWRSYNNTHEIKMYKYYLDVPRLLLEMENIGDSDAVIDINRSSIVDVHGIRSAEVFIETTNTTIRCIPAPYTSDYILDHLSEIVFGCGLIGACVGFLFALAMNKKFDVW